MSLIPYSSTRGTLSLVNANRGALSGGPTARGQYPQWDGDGWSFLSSFIDVRIFGALGDGSDDTTAFQDALNFGLPVFVPGGDWSVGTLNPPTGAFMFGVGGSGYVSGGQTAPGTTRRSRLVLRASTNGSMFYMAAGVNHVSLLGLQLDGNKSNQSATSYGINAEAAGSAEELHLDVHRCYIHNFRDIGIFVGTNRQAAHIWRSIVYDNGAQGVYLAATDSEIDSCLVGQNVGDNIVIAGDVTRIRGCELYSSVGGAGVAFSVGVGRSQISDCTIDRNFGHGLYVADNCDYVSIVNSLIHSNSQGANGTYDHIHVKDGATILCSGVSFGALEAGLTNKPQYAVNLSTTGRARGAGNRFASGGVTTGFSNAEARFTNAIYV